MGLISIVMGISGVNLGGPRVVLCDRLGSYDTRLPGDLDGGYSKSLSGGWPFEVWSQLGHLVGDSVFSFLADLGPNDCWDDNKLI